MATAALAPLAAAPVSGGVIIALTILAGIGTFMLLPSRREESQRRIGGALAILGGLLLAALVAHYTAAHEGPGVYFWIFSAIAIIGAVRVVTHPRPVYSALYFVLTVFASAGLFVLLSAEFMAAALVLIYAGAILITYVFVIMLAAQAQTSDPAKPMAGLAEYDVTSREPLVASCVGFALAGVLLFLIFDKADGLIKGVGPTPTPGAMPQPTQELALYLFQNQLVNLELAGIILTIAMVGAIIIARRQVLVVPETRGPVFDDEVSTPATPISDDPHSIPVIGSFNPKQKAYPEK
jgi:NADH-quinone oxidoreductase subunit J